MVHCEEKLLKEEVLRMLWMRWRKVGCSKGDVNLWKDWTYEWALL